MDEPVRPLIRFTTAFGGVIVEPMNGAVLGSAEWLGRIPPHTVEIAISPSQRIGPFNFRIDSIESETTVRLLLRGFFRSKLWTYWTLRCLAVGSRREAWQALKSATEGTPVEEYAGWHMKNARQPDFAGFDAPRGDPAKGPRFVIVVAVSNATPGALLRTVQSLTEQSYPHFIIAAISDEATPTETRMALRELAAGNRNFLEISENSSWAHLGASTTIGKWITVMNAGDILRPYALAAIVEELTKHPEVDAVYADEDCIAQDGTLHSPSLKPDWSPIYQAQAQYVERALFVRADAIAKDTWRSKPNSTNFMFGLLASLIASRIRHLRRVLYCRESPVAVTEKPMASNSSLPSETVRSEWPAVTVVIPTKDQPRLLATCLEGIKQKTDYPHVDIVIVDNGSTTPESVALLESLCTDGTAKIVRSPGPFNFSELCNAGASASESPILLFLNNDTEIRSKKGWLKALIGWAVLPQTGAVGARLLFADGRVQHAGVVLGLSGIAGHPYLHQREVSTGDGRWFDVAHEISAITGACLAITRKKFEAVGGFDEQLAVDLNDVDLCLRLSERGWTNVWTPEAELIHRESSSRGVARNYFEAYNREITYFTGRWAHVIRDDPYFHPALSLFAHDIMLA